MDEKVKTYMDFVDVFVETLDASRGTGKMKPGQASALGLKLSNLSLRLIVLAPSNIVDSYLKWRLLATSGVVNPEEIMEAFAEIIVEMRKDVTGEFGDVNTVLDALA